MHGTHTRKELMHGTHTRTELMDVQCSCTYRDHAYTELMHALTEFMHEMQVYDSTQINYLPEQ